MRSSSSLLSPPPSPHPPAPLPLSSSAPLTGCPDLDLSITLSPAPKTCNTQLKLRPQKASQQKPLPRGQVCFEEPVVVRVTPEPHISVNKDSLPQQPIKGQKRNSGRHHAPRQLVDPPAAASNPDPRCLEMAELNTTLALKAELQSLQGVEFNSRKAIQETLQRSERTKNLINTRATEVVNVSPAQLLFTSLVSVDVQEDQLISQVLQDRLLLALPPRCHGSKAAARPSLLPFMTSDLLRQKPLSPEEEPVNYKLHPSTRHPQWTFDLYRQRRRYEATP
ncbi:protein phosphatase 1 regulatory subunit 35 isoform X2 [Dicentrarchus labrax]|uniref:protein phosphatase 1 regulatory subunit 35 isoform X2 n=1 Tax=Dicentrarchus labrax TaxID=13489 RepID=UPI0021F61155|nr:protein phosphatase 1 regulatory subunit 35 isoform X2 [Dicentrarchus labrax]